MCTCFVCACEQFKLVTDLQSRNNRRCLRVERGDRLGVYFEHDPSALSLRYTTDLDHVNMLAHIFSNVSQPVSDSSEVVTFEQIVYPYDFIASAYFYYGKRILSFTAAFGHICLY